MHHISTGAEPVLASLGEGLTRRKRARDASIGDVLVAGDASGTAEGIGDAKKGRTDDPSAKAAPAAAGAGKAAADIPGADLPPVLAPPGRCNARAVIPHMFMPCPMLPDT